MVTFALVLLPLGVFAAGDTGIPVAPGGGSTGIPIAPGGGSTGYVQPQYSQPSSNSFSVDNPLAVSNICDVLRLLLNAAIIIGLPICVVFLILVGFQFVMARGSDTALTTAKKNLMYTVMGIAIFLGAWTIAQIIKATLQALGVTGFGSC